jgi:VWFA-related protein
MFCLLFLLSAGLAPATVLAQAGATAPAAPAQPGAQSGAQSDGKTPTLSLTANLVNLPVIVRDKKGALVQNLTKADFTLSVDGHPQVIRYFDRDQNLPLTLGLLVDTSQSQRSVLDEERDASSSFLDGMLTAPADRAPDRAFIIQFAREVELLQDLTSSRPKLQAAIKEIGTPNPNERSSDDDDNNGGNGNSNGNSGHYRGGGTALYDAVYLSANDLMLKQQGRKAVVILSDGVDRNSKETLNRAIEAAQRADMIVYAIYFKGQEQWRGRLSAISRRRWRIPRRRRRISRRWRRVSGRRRTARRRAAAGRESRRWQEDPAADGGRNRWPVVRGEGRQGEGDRHLQPDCRGAAFAIPARLYAGRDHRWRRLPPDRSEDSGAEEPENSDEGRILHGEVAGFSLASPPEGKHGASPKRVHRGIEPSH